MKCAECHSVIPEGKMYCPVCGAEVRLVPDFEPTIPAPPKDDKTEKEEPAKSRPRVNPRPLLYALGLALGLFTLFVVLIRFNSSANASYLSSRIDRYTASENGSKALADARKLAELTPEDDDVLLMYARLLIDEGHEDEAVPILRELIERNNLTTSACLELFPIYEKRGDTSAISALLNEIDDRQLHMEYALYASYGPVMSLVSGKSYPYGTRLTMRGRTGNIYYTTDGSLPDRTSSVYTGPILLPVGTTKVNAVTINKMGVRSPVVSGSFHVRAKSTPAFSLIAPEETDIVEDKDTEPFYDETYDDEEDDNYDDGDDVDDGASQEDDDEGDYTDGSDEGDGSVTDAGDNDETPEDDTEASDGDTGDDAPDEEEYKRAE